MTEEYVTYGHRLEPHIADTAKLCWEALDSDETVIFEGAQATMLDLDHGTYPFVTSSNPIAGAACVGAGVGPRDINEVWGVAKAYTTRVGAGPFPTELIDDDSAGCCVERGHEYGTTTGRERRCGWMDLVALRYAARLNRMTALVITKLDVLAGIDPLRVAVRYRSREGAIFDEFPYHQSILHSAERRLRGDAGFQADITETAARGRPPPRGPRLPGVRQRLRGSPGQARRRRPEPRPGGLDRRPAGGARPEPGTAPSPKRGTAAGGATDARVRDRTRGLLAALAAAQHAHQDDRGAEGRRDAEGELEAEQALAAPVDVAKVEQEGSLVEREAHARPHRDGEALFELFVVGEDGHRPRGERGQDPGDEVVDVAVADADISPRPPGVPDAPGTEPHRGEGPEEPGEHVEQDRLGARGGLVALHRDANGVDGRRGRRRSRQFCVGLARAAPQQAPVLARDHDAGSAQGSGRESYGRLLGTVPAAAGRRPKPFCEGGRRASPQRLTTFSAPASRITPRRSTTSEAFSTTWP